MIIKEYQEFKPVQRALGLKADGMPGPKTLAAVALKLRCHEIWSAVQAAVADVVALSADFSASFLAF